MGVLYERTRSVQIFQVPDAVWGMIQGCSKESGLSWGNFLLSQFMDTQKQSDLRGYSISRSRYPNGTTDRGIECLVVCSQTSQMTPHILHRVDIDLTFSYLRSGHLCHLLSLRPRKLNYSCLNKLGNEVMLGVRVDPRAKFSTHREPGDIKIQNSGRRIWNVCLQTVWFHVCLSCLVNTNRLIWGWRNKEEET